MDVYEETYLKLTPCRTRFTLIYYKDCLFQRIQCRVTPTYEYLLYLSPNFQRIKQIQKTKESLT